MIVVDTITCAGKTVEIVYDEGAASPREGDNLTKLALFHREYQFPWDVELPLRSAAKYDGRSLLEAIKTAERKAGDGVVLALPVWMLDHSGVALTTGDQNPYAPFTGSWDSGMIGFAIITRKSVEALMGWKRITVDRLEELKRQAKAEVEEYGRFVNGECFCFRSQDGDWVGTFYSLDDAKEAAVEELSTEKGDRMDDYVAPEMEWHVLSRCGEYTYEPEVTIVSCIKGGDPLYGNGSWNHEAGPFPTWEEADVASMALEDVK